MNGFAPQIPPLDLLPEIDLLWGEIQSAVSDVIRSGQFVLGPQVRAFESEIAESLSVKHAIACNSGTDALVLGLRALGIGPGDEVITTPFTFYATAEAISLVGAEPVFVDIEPRTFNIDPSQIPAALTPRTKAVLPVHLFGHAADLDPILEFVSTARADCAGRRRPSLWRPLSWSAAGQHRARGRVFVLSDQEPRRVWRCRSLGDK